jgi:hypothetical protein
MGTYHVSAGGFSIEGAFPRSQSTRTVHLTDPEYLVIIPGILYLDEYII